MSLSKKLMGSMLDHNQWPTARHYRHPTDHSLMTSDPKGNVIRNIRNWKSNTWFLVCNHEYGAFGCGVLGKLTFVSCYSVCGSDCAILVGTKCPLRDSKTWNDLSYIKENYLIRIQNDVLKSPWYQKFSLFEKHFHSDIHHRDEKTITTSISCRL